MARAPFTVTLRYDVHVDKFDQAREVGRQLAAAIDEKPTKIGDGSVVRHKLADFRVRRAEALSP